MRTMQGKVFRIVGEEAVEFVRYGEGLVAITDPILKECLGQLALNLTYGESNE